MTNMIMTNTQLEDNAKFFINEFCPEDSASTSMIVAGMVSIINGNEFDLIRIKKQKWFERIWYTITGKNKATVREMQARRDDLNKYLIKIISKLSDMARTNSAQAAELSSAILTLDNGFRDMKVSIDKIARALNDKILSLDTYTFIINDIRNKKYPADKPLLSLIDIMSQIDNRTAKDLNRLRQLKETMENSGFLFRSKINAQEYAEQVFSLPEEKVGRILLFCQNLSERSRFLAYTCNLIENYFYLGETDRDIVRSNEAVQESLRFSKLSSDSYCIVDKMYADLKEAIPEKFSQLSRMAEAAKISACIIGKDSVGKDDLFHVLKEYENFAIKSVNFELGCSEENIAKCQSVRKSIKNKEVNCVIYCVDVSTGKFEKQEIEFIKSLSDSFPTLKIAIALTYCVNKFMASKLADDIYNETGKKPICILAKNVVVREDITVSAFGVDDLVEEVRSM